MLAALLASLSRCRPEPADTPASFTDNLGREVVLKGPPRRVVTLAPNMTEIVYAAGAGDRLVGVTTADDYPPAIDSLPRISMLPTDFEAIAAIDPDLVLATDQVNAPREAETFEALGLPLYFFSFETLPDVFDGVRRAGQLLGTSARADAAADSLEQALDALRARTALIDERPRVLLLVGDETLYSFGAGSYVHALVEAAGGTSLTAAVETPAPVLTEEYVLDRRPDVIVGTFGPDYNPDRLRALHPTWDVVPAVRDGRVYSVDGDLLNRPGPRVVEGAFRIARHLHPSLFIRADSLAAP